VSHAVHRAFVWGRAWWVRTTKNSHVDADLSDVALAHTWALGTRSAWYDGGVNDPFLDNEFEREVLRLNRRYLSEVVERFSLCPWALRARLDGAVAERVLSQDSAEIFAPSLETLQALDTRSELDIGLFIYPNLELGRLEFEHFVRRLRVLDDARYPVGEVPFAMAAFHPDAVPDLDDAERLIPFLRRTPFPTIQVVRRTALERVRGAADEGTAFLDLTLVASLDLHEPATTPLRERIATANLGTVKRVGAPALETVIGDILRDRDETRARLAHAKPA